MTCKVQRPIDSAYFTNIPRIREMMMNLPKEVRLCSECGKEVEITQSEFMSNPGDSAPFAKAAFIGCDASIDKVIEGIRKSQN